MQRASKSWTGAQGEACRSFHHRLLNTWFREKGNTRFIVTERWKGKPSAMAYLVEEYSIYRQEQFPFSCRFINSFMGPASFGFLLLYVCM